MYICISPTTSCPVKKINFTWGPFLLVFTCCFAAQRTKSKWIKEQNIREQNTPAGDLKQQYQETRASLRRLITLFVRLAHFDMAWKHIDSRNRYRYPPLPPPPLSLANTNKMPSIGWVLPPSNSLRFFHTLLGFREGVPVLLIVKYIFFFGGGGLFVWKLKIENWKN